MKSILENIIIAVFALLVSAQASAYMVSNGDSFTVDWSVLSPNLSATSTWGVTFNADGTVTLDVTIKNTTTIDSTLTNADITALGFGVDPDATASFSTQGTVFDTVGTGSGSQETFPGGYKAIDVCIYPTAPCAGNATSAGLGAGDTDSFSLLLTASSGSFGNSIDLLFFPIKFQTNLGSYEPAGCVSGDTCENVPEPSTVALLGIGLVIIGFSRRTAL